VEGGSWEQANRQAKLLAKALKAFNAHIEEATRDLRSIGE
jgi:hypothetical protein